MFNFLVSIPLFCMKRLYIVFKLFQYLMSIQISYQLFWTPTCNIFGKKYLIQKQFSLEFPPHTKHNVKRSFYSHHLICFNLKYIIHNKYFSKFIVYFRILNILSKSGNIFLCMIFLKLMKIVINALNTVMFW